MRRRQAAARTASLYKRVRDREALLLLVADAVADGLAARLTASDGTIAGLAHAYRAFAHAEPEGFRLLLSVDGAAESFGRVAQPIIDATRAVVGEERALDAARLVTSWATGFISMELAGAFRLGGDLDEAFAYGLERLAAGLAADA